MTEQQIQEFEMWLPQVIGELAPELNIPEEVAQNIANAQSVEEVDAILNEISQVEGGQEILSGLISAFDTMNSSQQMMKIGGKLNYFVEKFGKGGKCCKKKCGGKTAKKENGGEVEMDKCGKKMKSKKCGCGCKTVKAQGGTKMQPIRNMKVVNTDYLLKMIEPYGSINYKEKLPLPLPMEEYIKPINLGSEDANGPFGEESIRIYPTLKRKVVVLTDDKGDFVSKETMNLPKDIQKKDNGGELKNNK